MDGQRRDGTSMPAKRRSPRPATVVELRGKPVGVALCETGSRRLSLFNILNMTHVFFSEVSEVRLATAVQAALLAAVLEF